MTEGDGWHGLFLGNSTMAMEPLKKLIEDFYLSVWQSENTEGMAIFCSWSPRDERGEDEVTAYYSPAASPLVELIPQAARCDRPGRNGLHLIAGRVECWQLLDP